MGSGPAIAVNAFNLSGIKTRIGMMNTDVPPARKAIRYIFITPFICLVYISVNPPKAVAGIQLPDMFTMNAAKTLPNSKQEAELLQALTSVENKRVDTTDPLQKEDRRVAAVNLLNEINYRVNIDAKTDTVRISLVPAEEIHGKEFDGIYIIGNNEYSDNEIRELAANGTYEILLPARPALVYYQPGHQQAIQQWGAKAANGVILIQPPSSITP
jgi:hypothetical protein